MIEDISCKKWLLKLEDGGGMSREISSIHCSSDSDELKLGQTKLEIRKYDLLRHISLLSKKLGQVLSFEF